MKKITDVVGRIVAVFALSVLSVIGAGAVVDVPTWQTAIMAGILGVANVIEEFARGYIYDGKLSDKEIEEAFRKAAVKDKQ
jgi:hypothetical protein